MDTLSDYIKEEIFSDKLPYKTIYSYHAQTQAKISELLSSINEENKILEKVIDPVNISYQASASQCLSEIEEKNLSLIEWYNKFPKIKNSSLNLVKAVLG